MVSVTSNSPPKRFSAGHSPFGISSTNTYAGGDSQDASKPHKTTMNKEIRSMVISSVYRLFLICCADLHHLLVRCFYCRHPEDLRPLVHDLFFYAFCLFLFSVFYRTGANYPALLRCRNRVFSLQQPLPQTVSGLV